MMSNLEEFRLLLPCHPTNEKYWKHVQQLLSATQPQTIEELVELLNRLIPSSEEGKGNELGTLVKFLSEEYKNTEHFFKHTLPRLTSEALRLLHLFPDGFITQLQSSHEQVLTFTKEQIACIIIHMFFGTIQRNCHLQFWFVYKLLEVLTLQRTSYQVWYSTNSRPITAYLHVLFEYLERIASDALDKKATVTFVRKVLPEEGTSRIDSPHFLEELEKNAPLIPVTFPNQGEITDCHGTLEVDFANKDVTFGRGGTQEEILLGMSPELHLFALIGLTLQDNESFVVNGAEKIGRHSGFGSDTKYEGPYHYDQQKSTDRFIVAIDATNYDEDFDHNQYVFLAEEQVKWIQYNRQCSSYQRELRKAFCGFRNSPSIFTNYPTAVATGGWGTGAFGGHTELKVTIRSSHTDCCKAIIQWMAASCAGMKELIYFPFGNEEFASEFSMFAKKCLEHSWTVAKLEEFLLSVVPIGKSNPKPKSVFSYGLELLSTVDR